MSFMTEWSRSHSYFGDVCFSSRQLPYAKEHQSPWLLFGKLSVLCIPCAWPAIACQLRQACKIGPHMPMIRWIIDVAPRGRGRGNARKMESLPEIVMYCN